MQTSYSTSTPSNWEGEVIWCLQTQPSVTTSSGSPGDCWPYLQTVGCSFEAICGGPQAGLTALPSPHTQTAALQGGSCKELSVEPPHRLKCTDKPFPTCPPLLFPLKCPFASSFGTYRSVSKKEAAPRVIRLQTVPKNKRLI